MDMGSRGILPQPAINSILDREEAGPLGRACSHHGVTTPACRKHSHANSHNHHWHFHNLLFFIVTTTLSWHIYHLLNPQLCWVWELSRCSGNRRPGEHLTIYSFLLIATMMTNIIPALVFVSRVQMTQCWALLSSTTWPPSSGQRSEGDFFV